MPASSEVAPEANADLTAPASSFATALLDDLIAGGVRDVVVCPGSRSQALALAAAAAEAQERIRLWVRIDERSAGFLALGLAVESERPVAVIVTSGTAVANLHPAVLEAHHSGVPLLLLTADRPDELRGIRSNQTTAQPGIFGSAVRASWDIPAPEYGSEDSAAAVAAAAIGAALGHGAVAGPGPVQLNLAFREPLSGPVHHRAVSVSAAAAPASPTPAAPVRPAIELPRGPRTVVIAGHGAGPAAEELAHVGGWPLIAEVSSGSRYGRALIVPYRELLDDPTVGGLIERVVIFGQPTLSRQVPALVRRADVETIVVAPTGAEVYDPGHSAIAAATVSVAAGERDRDWLGHWILAARDVLAQRPTEHGPDLAAKSSPDSQVRRAYRQTEFEAVRQPLTRRALVESVWAATWPHDRLVFGASRLIRVADEFVPGKKLSVHSNRGLAGIDGTVATATGIALASQLDAASVGVTRLLLGDLTLLHDVGSLLFGSGEERPRIQIVVGNDGGGTIFDSLEVTATAAPAQAERVLFTPQTVRIAALAEAYGWDYRKVAHRGELDQALTGVCTGPTIIEVPLPRVEHEI